MNNIFNLSSFRRKPCEMISWRTFEMGSLAVLVSALLTLCVGGCGDRDVVRVQLQAHTPAGPEVRRLEIRAQVSGAPAGLRYKWLSVAGECDPQESDWPATAFKFADGARKDRISLEVWRNDKRVGQSELDVKLDREPAPLTTGQSKKERLPVIQIQITNIPPYEPAGGPETHAEIGGTVSGELAPDYKIVIYARAADLWFIQPTPYTSHSIGPNNTWSTWTHTGSSYAVLVVRPGFDPLSRLDVLPQAGGYIIARTNVIGVQK
jgi:hypothetical protein